MRTAAAFRADPSDDLVRIGNVARLAMDAVGGINFRASADTTGVLFDLIDSGGAEILAGITILMGAAILANVEIGDA